MVRSQRRWTQHEDAILAHEVQQQREDLGEIRDWSKIAAKIPRRDNKDCRKRFYNEVTGGLKKGLWSKEEDEFLRSLVDQCGFSWAAIAKSMRNRSAEQCSKRWNHHLNPALDHSSWTAEESTTLLTSVRKYGTVWTEIQQLHFPHRSTNNIKNAYALLKHRGHASSGAAARRSGPVEDASYGASPLTLASTSDVLPQADGSGLGEPELVDVGGTSTPSEVFALDDLDLSAFPAVSVQELDALNHMGQMASWLHSPIGCLDEPAESLLPQPVDTQSRDVLNQGLGRGMTQLDDSVLDPRNSNDFAAGVVGGTLMSETGTAGVDKSHASTRQLYTDMTSVPQSQLTLVGSNVSRTYITIDDVDPSVLTAVMDILVRRKAKVRFETRQEPGTSTEDGP